MRFGRAWAGFFDAPGVAEHNQASGEAEVCRPGLAGEGLKLAGFDPAVSGIGLFKKGVSWRASSFCAFLNKRFWLPLTCKR